MRETATVEPLLLLRERTALTKPERGAARPDSIAFFRKEHLLAGCEAPHAAPRFSFLTVSGAAV